MMKTGDLFQHFKGGEYVVLAVAILESTKGTKNEQELVIYQSKEKKSVWARTVENFTEIIEIDGKTVQRFKPIGWEIVTMDQYEALALRTANSQETLEKSLTYGGMGSGGESGEVQGVIVEIVDLCMNALRSGKHDGGVSDYIKKVLFHGHQLVKEKLINEVGDALWYKNRILTAIGSSLRESATLNIKKLLDRYPDGFSKERSQNRAV